MGKDSYHANRGLISVLFKDKAKFIKNSGDANLLAVTKTLRENDLITLELKHISHIRLSFATKQKDALLFIKLVKEVLASLGYSHTLTIKARQDSSGFLWQIELRSTKMIDPYLIVSEFEKRGAEVTKIRRKSADNYRYNIDIQNSKIKTIQPTPNQELILKKPLKPYWIDVSGAKSIKITSQAGNAWHPYIVLYDAKLKIIDNYTKERKSYNISIKIPRNATYIKISDLYTLQNIKRGLKIRINK